MELAEAQKLVADFVTRNAIETDPTSRLLDLTSEVGELAKTALQATSYGKTAFTSSDAWKDELGDVFFSIICLANTTEVDLEDSLKLAIDKYNSRIFESGEPSSRERQA